MPLARRPRPPRPPTPPSALAPAPGPDPGSALRDVLVEVGEQQLAGAGLAALTRQVHGGRAAGGWVGPGARARRRGESRALRVGARPRSPPGSPQLAARGSTAASFRPRSCLCSGAGPPSAPAQPAPPPHGLSRRKRAAGTSRPFTSGPGRSSGRTRARAGRAGQDLRARERRACALGGVGGL